MNGDGVRPPEAAEKSLGEIVSDVSEKASLLVREEIELAKTEVQQKVSSLVRGAAVAAAAGVFLLFAFVFLLHTAAWFLIELLDAEIWLGFAIVTLVLVLLAAVAGFLAFRWLKRGAPPTPDLAIEEAKRTRAELERQTVERDQLQRGLEREEEARA